MNPSDAHQRTIGYAARVIDLIKAHRTSADPASYEVWYEHVSGQRRSLSAALKLRSAKGHVKDADVRELRATYLSSSRVAQTILDTGAGVSLEVSALLDGVRAALRNINGHDGELRTVAERLQSPDLTAADVKAALSAALDVTRRISETNTALEGNLQDSRGRIDDLTNALATARGEALTDGLTGLSNRRAFDERFADQYTGALRSRLPLSLIMIDIDHFKSFNDTHGHTTGDQVIRLVATAIKDRLEAEDFAARYGGEEFVILSLGRSLPAAVALAEEIRSAIGSYEIVQHGASRSYGKVTISAGVAALTPGELHDQLLKRADACLYEAKRRGRNRVEQTETDRSWLQLTNPA